MKKHMYYFLKLYFLITLTVSLQSQTIRIMPLGDSITQGLGSASSESLQISYRKYLWDKLNTVNYDVNFVGSQIQGSAVSPSFDYHHEGYAWWTTHNIANHIYGFLANNQTDIILLHIGSNDVSPNQSNSSSVAGLNNILNQIDAYENNYNHPIRVILATIIQRTSYHSTLRNYNINLINLANSRIANGDKITLVDMEYSAGLNGNDYADGVHPDHSGYTKMSNVWFNALKNILPPPKPTQPTNIAVSSILATSATLTWNDTSSNESGFNIYQDGILIATVAANITSFTPTNLASNTTYDFVIRSYNSGGESGSTLITFITKLGYSWLPAVYHVILN